MNDNDWNKQPPFEGAEPPKGPAPGEEAPSREQPVFPVGVPGGTPPEAGEQPEEAPTREENPFPAEDTESAAPPPAGQAPVYGNPRQPFIPGQPYPPYGQVPPFGNPQQPFIPGQPYPPYGQVPPFGNPQQPFLPGQPYPPYGQVPPFGNPQQPFLPGQPYPPYGQVPPFENMQQPAAKAEPEAAPAEPGAPTAQEKDAPAAGVAEESPAFSEAPPAQPQQPAWQPPAAPYGQMPPYPPYQYGPYQPQPWQPPAKPPKKKMSGGLKAFLWILSIVAGALIIAFFTYAISMGLQYNRMEDPSTSQGSSSSQSSSSATPLPEPPSFPNGGTEPGSSGISLQARPSTQEMSPKQVYKDVVESVVGVVTTVRDSSGREQKSEGSGIIATESGLIITNAHVVGNSKAYSVQVVLHNNKTYPAVVVGYDVGTDLAVLRINAEGLVPAAFGDSSNVEIGDMVVAIGNPGGLNFSGSQTVGYISAVNRTLRQEEKDLTFLQTDAAINPGNSGGALVNMYGQVIGISSNKIANVDYEGMGFAIPTSRAKIVLDDLIQKGYVSGRGRLGVTVRGMTVQQFLAYGINGGVLIEHIDSSSDAYGKAQAGDVIVAADGTAISSTEDLYVVLARHKAGDTVTLKLRTKEGGSKEIKVTLLPDEGQIQQPVTGK